MGYGEIIKRAWTITWRYRALWVLGLFAGVTGASGGGSGGSGNYGSSTRSGSGSSGSGLSNIDGAAIARGFERLLPVIIVVTVGLIIIGIVWWILSVAARGGLVYAVNEIEEGRPVLLGKAWNAGFARFWSIFGIAFILSLPVFLLLLLIALGIVLPILGPIVRGAEPGGWVVAPICGTLAIGIPLLIVLSVVLGLMHTLALRYVMLAGHGAVHAIDESWRAFRGRFKDTILMWLIGWGLNIAAGIVIAIPVVIITLLIVVPAVASAVAGQWAAFAVVLFAAVVVLAVISLAFTAIWGTYTSALWTIFYRRFTGMALPAMPQQAPPAPPYPPAPPAPPAPQAPQAHPEAQAPPVPPPPMPPMAPPPPPPPFAPEIAP